MRKFVEIYKEKLNEAEVRQENKVLEEFKLVYGAMLEHYGLTSVKQLDDESQISFLTELNHYWSEEAGLSEKGENFIAKRAMSLNENSTAVQKKNFLRNKSYAVINETFRQTNLRYKLYDILDEIYHQTNAKNITEILPIETIKALLTESFNKSLNDFIQQINNELSESAKSAQSKRKYYVKVKSK